MPAGAGLPPAASFRAMKRRAVTIGVRGPRLLVEDDHHHTLQGSEAMLVTAPETDADDLLRLPGLFRRWELEQIVEAGKDYRIEDAGTANDGTPLFAVYRRQPDGAMT